MSLAPPRVCATAPITNATADVARPYAFQTPVLRQGQTYESGTPGFPVSTTSTSSTAYWTWSTGTLALSRANPPHPTKCGVNVALIIDLSASVDLANATGAMRDAAKTYVDALLGTPSQVQLFSFGTDATADTGLIPVSTPAEVDVLKAQIDLLTPGRQSYTSWDDAFWLVQQQTTVFDLAVIVTDGNPTVFQADKAGRNTRFAEVEAGIFSANALKAKGTSIQAVGVGDAVLSPNAALNLKAISGESDYIQADTYAEAGDALRDSVFTACAPSLTVVKEVVPADGGPRYAASGWTFGAETASEDITSLAPSGTTDVTGAVNFPLDFDSLTGTASITITEQQKPGYRLMPQDAKNAVCTVKNAANPLGTTLDVTDAGDLGFTIEVSATDMVSCLVVNQAPPLLPDLLPASLTVVKQVVPIDGQPFLAGGWTFDATAPSDAVTLLGSSGTTEDGTGSVAFPLELTAPDGAAVTITERQQEGYVLLPQDGANATCTVKNLREPDGAPLDVVDVERGFVVEVEPGDEITCTVTNAETLLTPAPVVLPGQTTDLDSDVSSQVLSAEGRTSGLASTGAQAQAVAVLVGVLVLAGIALVLVSRRRAGSHEGR
ncbi:MAG: VWA domain-containing protein [Micrococcales bacterium]|nr:VWA domain-containing protein [Micrococcales bacterium]